MNWLIAPLIGLVAGVSSGLFGIGGGIVIVPMLMYFAKFNQQASTATSLIALLLPVGGLGVWEFYRNGLINIGHIKFGLLVAVGLTLGAWFGAKIAISMNPKMLTKIFSVFLFFVAVRIWFK